MSEEERILCQVKWESQSQWTCSNCLVDLHFFGSLQIEKQFFIQEVYFCGISDNQYSWSGKRLYEIIKVNKHSDEKSQHYDVACEWCAHTFEVVVTYSSFILLIAYLKVKLYI